MGIKGTSIAITAVFVLMLIIHQDFWAWGNESLIFGFMPVGLFYHTIFSIFCALLGWAAVRYAWPHELEEKAEKPAQEQEVETSGGPQP